MIYFQYTPQYINGNRLIPSNIVETFQYENGNFYAKSTSDNLREFDSFYPYNISEQEYNEKVRYLPTGSI